MGESRYRQQGRPHIMSFKRPNPVACRPVSEHRLLVEACTEEKDSINRLRRELQLDDGAAMAGTHDGNLPHKINAGLWTGGCLDHVRVLCVHARATAASKGELTMGYAEPGQPRVHDSPLRPQQSWHKRGLVSLRTCGPHGPCAAPSSLAPWLAAHRQQHPAVPLPVPLPVPAAAAAAPPASERS